MSMYNLIEYSDVYLKYDRDEPALDAMVKILLMTIIVLHSNLKSK